MADKKARNAAALAREVEESRPTPPVPDIEIRYRCGVCDHPTRNDPESYATVGGGACPDCGATLVMVPCRRTADGKLYELGHEPA